MIPERLILHFPLFFLNRDSRLVFDWERMPIHILYSNTISFLIYLSIWGRFTYKYTNILPIFFWGKGCWNPKGQSYVQLAFYPIHLTTISTTQIETDIHNSKSTLDYKKSWKSTKLGKRGDFSHKKILLESFKKIKVCLAVQTAVKV